MIHDATRSRVSAVWTDQGNYGFPFEGELERPVVVAPHLDDAVISCAFFLMAHPGTPVITVFAGTPERYPDPPNWWDAVSGFSATDDSMAVRRQEDAAALADLGAVPVWLPFCQQSHVQRGDRGRELPDGITDRLAEAIRRHAPTSVLLPSGLLHVDHDAVFRVGLEVRDRMGGDDIGWFMYNEIDTTVYPGFFQKRMHVAHEQDVGLSPVALPVVEDRDRKWDAYNRYVTQLAPLDLDRNFRRRMYQVPETYWRVHDLPGAFKKLAVGVESGADTDWG